MVFTQIRKGYCFGFLFFITTIILVLQFVPVGAASMADRYTYVPYIGVFFIVGKLFEYLSNSANTNYKKYKNYIAIVFVLGFIAFSTISYTRVQKWENDETLFSDAKKKYPLCDVPYFIIGDYYLTNYKANVENKNNREMYIKIALSEYENALKYSLNEANKVKAYYNLGTAKVYLGDFAGSKNDYDNVLTIDKNHINAYINRGNAKRELKDYEGSIEDLNKAIKLDPQNALAYNSRGITKYNFNDYKGAVEDFNMTIKFDINNPKAYNNRGSAKYLLKNYEGALEDYIKAVELDSKFTDAINNRDMVISVLNNSKK